MTPSHPSCIIRTADVLELVDAALDEGLYLEQPIHRTLNVWRQRGQVFTSIKAADRILCAIGRPDRLHVLLAELEQAA